MPGHDREAIMRCNPCVQLWRFVGSLLSPNDPYPGPAHAPDFPHEEAEVEGAMQPLVTRPCKNIKSRKNPDVQCPFPAIQGEFCCRHSKNPRRFIPPIVKREVTRADHATANQIRLWWLRCAPLHRYRTQGPAANDLSLSMNTTELYTLGPIGTIPPIYRFSFASATPSKTLWMFDIRTLVYSLAKGVPQINPYNREPLGPAAIEKLHARVASLRKRKFQIEYMDTDTLTPDQLWNQRVLDSFLRIESLGYYVSSDWFHSLGQPDHCRFYERLQGLWSYRLGLTPAMRELVVPGHSVGRGSLFPLVAVDYYDKSLRWWQTMSIELIEKFIGRAADSENRRLGAMYVLMAFVQVSRPAARAMPWVVESLR